MHQYQRCACILVDDINLREEENEGKITEKVKNVLIRNLGFDGEEVQQEFGKSYRLGPVKDGQKTTIVRIKSNKFKEVYKKRKTTKTKKFKSNFHQEELVQKRVLMK